MKIKEFTLTAIFISIIFLFAFTPIGFIHLGVIRATMIHIPVIIGAIVLGPKAGALLGFTFGLTSLINNTIAPSLLSFAFSPAIPVLGTSQGSFWALVVAFLPRILVGIIPFYLFRALKSLLKDKFQGQKTALFTSALITTVLHTFMVMGLIAIIFNDAYAQAIGVDSSGAILLAVLGVFLSNGISEALVAAFVVAMVVPPLFKLANK